MRARKPWLSLEQICLISGDIALINPAVRAVHTVLDGKYLCSSCCSCHFHLCYLLDLGQMAVFPPELFLKPLFSCPGKQMV